MPPCIGYILPKPGVRFGAFWITRRLGVRRRLYASDATSRLEKHKVSELAHGPDILTALHRTNRILPNVLLPVKVEPWSKLLRMTGDILSGATVRRPRIAVLGLDKLSQPHELVSALLDDPLASDQKNIQALRNRRRQTPNDIVIISPGELEQSNTTLSLSLPWLKKMDVDILEIPSEHPDKIPLLYDADVQVLIASPVVRPLDLDFHSLLLKSSSFIILQYPTFDQHIVDYTLSQLTLGFPAITDTIRSKILPVYPSKALSALDLFRQESTSLNAIQAFQNDFLSSGVTALSRAISTALSLDQETRKARHAQLVLTGALEACHSATKLVAHDATAVQTFVDELRSRISRAQSNSVRDVLGGSDAPEVRDAVQRSTREMRVVMDAISWWKLPFKVDDLGAVLSSAAERVWCRDLYAKLEFQTGRLACLRSTLTSETLENLRLLPSPFHSALLVNRLHQLSTRPPELAPNTLTYPLSYRLQQLQQPILSLHRRAQRAMLTVFLTTFGTAGGAYTAWLSGWLHPPTAVGLGALAFMVGLRWFVGRWAKGKTRWWEDWDRVGEGLERDIKNLLALVVHEKVTGVPSKAAEELEKAIALRLSEVAELRKELESIEGGFRRSPLDEHTPVQ